MRNSISLMLALASLFLLAACGSVNVDDYLPDKKVEYKKSEQADRDLEVPPDLTRSSISSELAVPDGMGAGTATYSDFVNRQRVNPNQTMMATNVLPKVSEVELRRDGDERWLVIKSSPQLVWPQVIGFWQQNGILLVEQDPTVGVMRTAWVENRMDIASDPITGFIRRAFDGLYEAATRDQYRVRIEEGDEPGTTELYLTHFGAEQKLIGSPGGNETDQAYWDVRPRDPGLEAEMLRRLMIHLGVSEASVQKQLLAKKQRDRQRSRMVRGRNDVSLLIDETFSRSWRLTGLALDRVGFAVEDRDRSGGIYYVRYNDPMADVNKNESWLGKLAFWSSGDDEAKDRRYQIRVEPASGESQVTVHDEQGSRLASETAARILTLIHEQIR